MQVSGWEVHNVISLQGRGLLSMEMDVTEWARDEFWVAPEVLSQRSLSTMAADVYSFAIVMQEIFSRDIPYSEQSAFMSPGEALEKVVCESLRPHFTPDTPLEAREIMQHCWEMDPLARPSMTTVVVMIKKACPKLGSVMDSMLDSLTRYVTQLEDMSHLMTEDKTAGYDMGIATRGKPTVLPPAIARVVDDTDFQPQLFESVTVLVMSVHNMDSLIPVSSPQEVTELMTDLYQAVDMILDRERYKAVLSVALTNDVYTLASGVPQRSNDHLMVIASLALDLMAMASTFTIRHRGEERLLLRIGLGIGSVIAGLAGHDVRHFTMFGDALSHAQNMAATSLPSGIQFDSGVHSTMTTLKNFTFVERKHSKEDKVYWARSYWLIGHRDMTETFMPEC